MLNLIHLTLEVIGFVAVSATALAYVLQWRDRSIDS